MKRFLGPKQRDRPPGAYIIGSLPAIVTTSHPTAKRKPKPARIPGYMSEEKR